jgi:hypothetical protein
MPGLPSALNRTLDDLRRCNEARMIISGIRFSDNATQLGLYPPQSSIPPATTRIAVDDDSGFL